MDDRHVRLDMRQAQRKGGLGELVIRWHGVDSNQVVVDRQKVWMARQAFCSALSSRAYAMRM